MRFTPSLAAAHLDLVKFVRYWITIPIALVVIGIGSIAAALLLNPLRRSETDIRGWVLQQAPLGSSREEVMVLVARRGWKFHPEYRGRFINKSVPVGGFGAELGTYLGVRDVKVDAYWKFGGSDKLDEVYVNKWKEGF